MSTGRHFEKLRILVVDDEPECGEFFKSVLENDGATVDWARDAESGIHKLRARKFDVILTDKNLPNMDGIAFIKFIRECYGDMPVILITGQGTIGSAVDAFKLGAQDYLLKPLDDPDTLLRAVWGVTEHHRLENENKLLQQKLIHAERMESLGMLAAGVAHEINNPTSFVIGNLELLKEDIGDLAQISNEIREIAGNLSSTDQKKVDSAKVRIEEISKSAILQRIQKESAEMVDDAIDGAERIKRIVGSLRGFAHVDTQTMGPIDVNDEVERSLTLVWSDLKYKCKVIKELQDVPKVIGNPSQIDQVLVNILINAGQSIEGKDGRIIITTTHEKALVRIKISDNGQGISEEHMEHIFDPFFTTKEVGVGTGLGLYIAYGIMKHHGGMIEVTSRVGEGTTFVLTFPEGGNNG